MLIRHTPPSLHPPFANYAHAVEVPPGARLLVLSGQLAITPEGHIPEGAEAQADLIFANIGLLLASAGMAPTDLVRLNAYVTGREHLKGYMAARDRFVPTPPPASTLMIVAGFTRPEYVVEVEALAARLPDPA